MEEKAKEALLKEIRDCLSVDKVMKELASNNINIFAIRGMDTDKPVVDFEFQWLLMGKTIKWTKMSMPLVHLDILEKERLLDSSQGVLAPYCIGMDASRGANNNSCNTSWTAYQNALRPVDQLMYEYYHRYGSTPIGYTITAKPDSDTTSSAHQGDVCYQEDSKYQVTIMSFFDVPMGEVEMAIHYGAILELVWAIRSELEK